MMDRVFYITLILNATGLFRFVALPLGVPISTISGALLCINIGYLLAKGRIAKKVILTPVITWWFVVLIAWPFATILYGPELKTRELGLYVYFFTLFWGSTTYIFINGLESIYRVFKHSLIIALIGLILSLASPEYFEGVSKLANANITTQGRASGFSLQPNQLAIGITLLFIGWFSLWPYKGETVEPLVIISFLCAVLLTGSRAGLAIALLCVGLIIASRFWLQGLKIKSLVVMLLFALLLVGSLQGIRLTVETMPGLFGDGLRERVERITNLSFARKGKDIFEDGSVADRLSAQTVYWSLIMQKPILGHGFGSENYYKNDGVIFLSAHSDALARAAEYGLIYSVMLALLLVGILWKKQRRVAERVFGTNSITQISLISILLFAFNGGLLESRAFYISYSLFIATTAFANSVLPSTPRRTKRITLKRDQGGYDSSEQYDT